MAHGPHWLLNGSLVPCDCAWDGKGNVQSLSVDAVSAS